MILGQFDGSRPNDDSGNETSSFDVSPTVDDISQHGGDGDEDNCSEIDDETHVIDKLIKSSKKPRKNARHFVPDQSNILTAGRSMRSQHRTSVKENNSQPLTESLDAENTKKKRGNRTQRASRTKASKAPSVNVRAVPISNLSNNRVTPLTNDKEEIMKYVTEMKKATEALVKRSIEETNELHESRAAKKLNNFDDPMRFTQKNPSNDFDNGLQRDQMLKSKFNDVKGGSIHLSQVNHHPQQQQYQTNDSKRGQQQHHDLQRDSMYNQFNNNNHNYNQHHQDYLSDQHNHDYQQQHMYNKDPFNNHHQQEQYASINNNRGQQHQHIMSTSNGHDIQRSSMHQSQFSHHPQQHQYVMNNYNGQQQHNMSSSNSHDIQRSTINQGQFSHHPQQQQYNHCQQQYHAYNPNIHDLQHGSLNYQFGQQQLQYHQHVYPQSYSQPHNREEISTFKKVMLCDMMDIMKKIN